MGPYAREASPMTWDQGIETSSPAGGLLVRAFEAGATEALAWVDVAAGPLTVSVAADAMKAPLLGDAGVRLPVSYKETVALCRALGCVAPDRATCDAMFAQARPQLDHVGLVATAADAKHMREVGFALKFHRRVEARLAAATRDPGAPVFGAWKLWILHPWLAKRGAVNYGFWDTSRRPPAPIQSPGARHDAAHYDYSQLFQPVKRVARRTADGAEVDLLDELGRDGRIPKRFLDAYR